MNNLNMFFDRIGRLSVNKKIHAPINLCYNVVRDVEYYPNFLQNVENVYIKEENPERVNYKIDHNLKLVGYRLSLDYRMQLYDNKIKIMGNGNDHINYIQYHWHFKDLDLDHTKINLDLEIEFSDWSYFPLWLGIKDVVKEKTMREYIQRIILLKKIS